MGVYVPTGDATAVRRTADYFLKTFQVRARGLCAGCSRPRHAYVHLQERFEAGAVALCAQHSRTLLMLSKPLSNTQDRLDIQKTERTKKGDAYSASFKPQRTKDEVRECECECNGLVCVETMVS